MPVIQPLRWILPLIPEESVDHCQLLDFFSHDAAEVVLARKPQNLPVVSDHAIMDHG